MKKLLTVLLLCTSLLFAANSNYNYEITPMIGGVNPEGNLDLDDQQLYGVSIGRYLEDDSIFDQIEIGILGTTSTDYILGSDDTYITRFFTNLINEYEMNETASLYSLVGLGYEAFSKEKYENEDGGFANYGLGLKFKLSESVSLKTDVRHLINFEGDNNLLYTLGLGISFGEKAKPVAVVKEKMKEKPVILDDDKDGVINSKDKCPTTPRGAKVNQYGCELDDDKDGVVNSKDKCPTTPMGAKVNQHGCELDDDKDGVVNSKDKCPTTPSGAKVNQHGCELDDDKDGVVNSIDKCPDTIYGATIDNHGCAVTVDLHINFDTDSSIIKNTYENKIEEFANFLKKYPSVKAKIEAHTDSTGSQKYNEKLSQRRANSAVKALVDLQIDANRLEAIGYGELKPIQSNQTKEGRASNRRVEAIIIK